MIQSRKSGRGKEALFARNLQFMQMKTFECSQQETDLQNVGCFYFTTESCKLEVLIILIFKTNLFIFEQDYHLKLCT